MFVRRSVKPIFKGPTGRSELLEPTQAVWTWLVAQAAGSPTVWKWRQNLRKWREVGNLTTFPAAKHHSDTLTQSKLETNSKRRPPPTNPSMGKRGGSSSRATATAPFASSTSAAGPDASRPASNPVCSLRRTTFLILSIRDLSLANVCIFLRLQGATTGGRKRKAPTAPRKPRKAQVRGFVMYCIPNSSLLAFS